MYQKIADRQLFFVQVPCPTHAQFIPPADNQTIIKDLSSDLWNKNSWLQTEMANSRHLGWALPDKEAKVDDIKNNMNNILIKVRIWSFYRFEQAIFTEIKSKIGKRSFNPDRNQ